MTVDDEIEKINKDFKNAFFVDWEKYTDDEKVKIAKAILIMDPSMIITFPDDLWGLIEIVAQGVRKVPSAFKYAPEEYKSNKEYLLEVYKKVTRGEIISEISPGLFRDKFFVDKLVGISSHYVEQLKEKVDDKKFQDIKNNLLNEINKKLLKNNLKTIKYLSNNREKEGK